MSIYKQRDLHAPYFQPISAIVHLYLTVFESILHRGKILSSLFSFQSLLLSTEPRLKGLHIALIFQPRLKQALQELNLNKTNFPKGKIWPKVNNLCINLQYSKQLKARLTLSVMRACIICQERFMAPSFSAKSVLSLRLLSKSCPLICSTDWFTKSTVSCLQFTSTRYP